VTSRYLLDTNVLSEPLRPRPNPRLLRKLRRHEAALATAAPVWHELRFGCWRLPDGARRDAIRRYLLDVVQATLEILPYSTEAAEWHALERARLERLGRPPAFVDGQIAAIAATAGLVLVTHDTAGFSGFRGLKVEDWLTG
jgi:tRNA(fMet)-specific endonuclease VapC